jgi:hypothetical protein
MIARGNEGEMNDRISIAATTTSEFTIFFGNACGVIPEIRALPISGMIS